jgi:hypothetical protein
MFSYVFLVSVFPAVVCAWGGVGHKLVARVATMSLIRKQTRRFLREHLLEERMSFRNSISRSALWADSVEWGSDLHFLNIPYRTCEPLDPSHPCGIGQSDRCIVTAIADYTRRAGDLSLPAPERSEAIKFLIHLVADAHQPLHAGFERDRGGTNIILDNPVEMSLHEVWDTTLVDMLSEYDDSPWFELARSLSESLENNPSLVEVLGFRSSLNMRNITATVVAMVSETVTEHTCTSAYMNEEPSWINHRGDALSDTYMRTRSEVVRKQLLRASVRLAQILDFIASRFIQDENRKAISLLPTHLLAPGTRFAGLDFDLDLEEAVYEVQDDEEDEESAEETVRRDAAVGGSGLALTTDDPSAFEGRGPTTMSPEEKRRLSNRKKRDRAKVSKRKLFGVDVDSVVLIKHRGLFYLTYRQFVDKAEALPFLPDSVVPFLVRFGSGSPTPIMFDVKVFGNGSPGWSPEPALLEAIFRKIGGIEEGPAELYVPSTPSPEGRVLGYLLKVSELKKRLPSGMEMPMVNLIPASESESSLLPPALSREELRMRYGGTIPDNDKIALDIIDSQLKDVVAIDIGGTMVVSKLAYLLDETNQRWVFRTEKGMSSENPTEKLITYMDVRLLSMEWGKSLMARLSKHVSGAIHGNLVRTLSNRGGSRILPRLCLFGSNGDDFGNWDVRTVGQIHAAFHTRRSVGPKTKTEIIEIILRPHEEEARILALLGLPSIPRLGFRYARQ